MNFVRNIGCLLNLSKFGPPGPGPGPLGRADEGPDNGRAAVGPWAKAHGPRPMGQGPWALAQSPITPDHAENYFSEM